MSTQNRQPAGIPVGGQFAASARTEPDVTLAQDLPDEAYRAEVPIVAHFTVDRNHHDPLPEWPEGVPQPDVSFEYDDGELETTFTFESGVSVRFWTVNDENHSTLLDEGDQVTELDSDPDAWWAAREWMDAVHNRVESAAYGAAVATQTGAVQEAILANALGRPQPAALRTPTDQALARAHAMLEAWNPKAASLDFRNDARDRDLVMRDMLTDLRYLADLYGVDFDGAAGASRRVYTHEIDEVRAAEAAS